MTLPARIIEERTPESIIAKACAGADEGILYDAVYDSTFREFLIEMIGTKKRARGKAGELMGLQGRQARKLLNSTFDTIGWGTSSQVLSGEQSNTSITYGETFYFKLFRNIREGVNPDSELAQFLTERTNFAHVPPFAGSLEYRRPNAAPVAVGVLQSFVPAHSNGWSYALDALGRHYEQILSRRGELEAPRKEPAPAIAGNKTSPSVVTSALIEAHFLEMISLLGKRTAELHLALASEPDDPDFQPEPFTVFYQRSVYQSMRALARQVFQLLGKTMKSLTAEQQERAERLLDREEMLLELYGTLLRSKLVGKKIRVHGDYHLGQVLFTGKDFFIIDFEGEPARSLSERRIKRSPLRDVAGMIRSFHYAADFALLNDASLRAEDRSALEGWADIWFQRVSSVFLQSYVGTVRDASIVPDDPEEFERMLKIFLLDKAVYELGYELNNRPEWAVIPMKGLENLLG
jgi:maltose alpha-D-glucosyltransferase/alpha-amylase